MVELLGSLLAKYCTGQFWWLSFFVNRLPGSYRHSPALANHGRICHRWARYPSKSTSWGGYRLLHFPAVPAGETISAISAAYSVSLGYIWSHIRPRHAGARPQSLA